MMEKDKINFCEAFYNKVKEETNLNNQVRYLLEDFFFNEGWSSRTNPKEAKEGFCPQLTYNEQTIKHFIEDFVRWIEHRNKRS